MNKPTPGDFDQTYKTPPQEWTEETVVDFILDAFESAGETRAIKLISERHNAALAAEQAATDLEWKRRCRAESDLAAERQATSNAFSAGYDQGHADATAAEREKREPSEIAGIKVRWQEGEMTRAEWTTDWVRDLYERRGYILKETGWQAICDAHNAALAAERERGYQAMLDEREKVTALEDKLAAERERNKTLVEALEKAEPALIELNKWYDDRFGTEYLAQCREALNATTAALAKAKEGNARD